MIVIESKRKKPETILRRYPGAVIADVTSHAGDDLVKLSPFYPHGGIPVPFSEGFTATCVEAVWQGLKVFEGADVDTSLFLNDTMKNLKRTVRRFGRPLGHRKGVYGKELLAMSRPVSRSICRHINGCWRTRCHGLSKGFGRRARPRRSCCWTMRPTAMWTIRGSRCHTLFWLKAYAEGIYPYGDKEPVNQEDLKLF